MRIQRHMTMPGIDSLWERGRSCRDFKETASVAHFLQRPFWCENQILQGADSFISPEKLRYGTNAIGAWGPTLLTPWFSYGKEIGLRRTKSASSAWHSRPSRCSPADPPPRWGHTEHPP